MNRGRRPVPACLAAVLLFAWPLPARAQER